MFGRVFCLTKNFLTNENDKRLNHVEIMKEALRVGGASMVRRVVRWRRPDSHAPRAQVVIGAVTASVQPTVDYYIVGRCDASSP